MDLVRSLSEYVWNHAAVGCALELVVLADFVLPNNKRGTIAANAQPALIRVRPAHTAGGECDQQRSHVMVNSCTFIPPAPKDGLK